LAVKDNVKLASKSRTILPISLQLYQEQKIKMYNFLVSYFLF
jgi:hypothetical protein